ncbi:MAG: hypothetical protein J4415_02440 [Candidatus Diapherotrites archaeon]|uniref:Uncharacterized protein n=1 Tax=Candidatus Iainarchaeum sp. TaxID=3101447 RepID=A0A8T4KU40_9ARCH|nr:hypothetical protein [Candidatus Diapherotrites archaeon]
MKPKIRGSPKQLEFKQVADLFLGRKTLTFPEIQRIQKKNNIPIMAYTSELIGKFGLKASDFLVLRIKTPPNQESGLLMHSAYPESPVYFPRNKLSKGTFERIKRAFETVNRAIDSGKVKTSGDLSESTEPPHRVYIASELFGKLVNDRELVSAVKTVNNILVTTIAAQAMKPGKPQPH